METVDNIVLNAKALLTGIMDNPKASQSCVGSYLL
jgi:hypothetical protein